MYLIDIWSSFFWFWWSMVVLISASSFHIYHCNMDLIWFWTLWYPASLQCRYFDPDLTVKVVFQSKDYHNHPSLILILNRHGHICVHARVFFTGSSCADCHGRPLGQVLDLSEQNIRHCGNVFENPDLHGLTDVNLNDNLLTSAHPLRWSSSPPGNDNLIWRSLAWAGCRSHCTPYNSFLAHRYFQ